MMIRVIDGFLDPFEMRLVRDEIDKKGYSYGWKSNNDDERYRHWNCSWGGERENPEIRDYDRPVDLETIPEIMKPIWSKLNKRREFKHQLVRLYSNGYTYGTEGTIHRDSRLSENITHLIYINDKWEANWAGETVFFNDEDDIIRAILPKPGRLVEFEGDIRHAARSVSKFCPILRQIIVFKSIPLKGENHHGS